MLVTIIGSGNVAAVLGKALVQKGYVISEIYSRDPAHAVQLAQQLHAKAITALEKLDKNADIYLIAVSDDALTEVAAALSLKDKLVIHTAGSVSKEILKNVSTNYGVLWPMKMIRKSMDTLGPVTIVVDGNTKTVTDQIAEFATVFSNTVAVADDIMRSKMHILAAFTSNFANHLYHLAADYCEAENIDLSLFYSIIEETAQQIRSHHPKDVQAGPAFRGDLQTLEKHVQILAKYPQLRKLYEAMTESIEVSFNKNIR
ncbi:MAG: F420-dependent NADP oxidoreductase [Sediminibacterium sp.]